MDEIWEEKPKRPAEEVEVLGMEFAGKSLKGKVEEVRRELRKGEEGRMWGVVVGLLDEVCCELSCLRGGWSGVLTREGGMHAQGRSTFVARTLRSTPPPLPSSLFPLPPLRHLPSSSTLINYHRRPTITS